MQNFFTMSSAQIDRMAERHYDRMLAEYQGGEDPWEHDNPDWKAVLEILSDYDPEDVADLVRGYLENDGNAMTDVCDAGLLDEFIAPEDRWMLKDPDNEWRLVDGIFDKQWENDDLMIRIWETCDEICKGICEQLIRQADEDWNDNKIRQEYNERHGRCE